MTSSPTATTLVHVYKWTPIQRNTGEDGTEKKTSKKEKLAECIEVSKNPNALPRKYLFTRPKRVTYICNYCEKKFKNENEISKHIKSHSVVKEKLNHICNNNTCGISLKENLEERYCCIQCDKSFDKFLFLLNHSRTHNWEKSHLYKFCSKEYTCSFVVSTHMKCTTYKNGKKLTWYECKTCTKIFLDASMCAEHELIHTKEYNYICSHCQNGFLSDVKLKTHILRVHTGDKLNKCTFCEKQFYLKANLMSHMRVHTNEKPYKCLACGKCFSDSSNLNVHRRHVHPNQWDKSFPCEQCPSIFKFQHRLTSHMSIYHGPVKRQFKCQLCPKKFITKPCLKQHLRSHTKEKPYQCKYCDKAYGTPHSLNLHFRTHTKEKPFKCLKCDKRFSQLSVKVLHLRTHTGEKPYTCKFCKRKFSQNCNLKTHLLTHTKELPYKCHLCIKSFSQKGNLESHLSKIHT